MIGTGFLIKIDLVARWRSRGGCSYRVSRFSLSAAATSISTEKYLRVCVFSCKRVSESHCEAPGIYNYLCRGIIPTRLRSKQTRGRGAKERGWKRIENKERDRVYQLWIGIALVGRPIERVREAEGGDTPIVMERAGKRGKGDELAINFGREECGAHVQDMHSASECERLKLQLNAS